MIDSHEASVSSFNEETAVVEIFSSLDKSQDTDAGLKHFEHYRHKLPRWRYDLRQKILPLVRWETPYLAYIQKHVRTDFLDTYFALSANLGTHTFFMVVLPMLFWFGHSGLGRGFVHILATGVFLSGFIKDLLCLPRPLSPPLHRINMSGSTALEYGFPSTHSTNAISVVFFVLLRLNDISSRTFQEKCIITGVAVLYGLSITFGRIYCGMHGFLDVIVGSFLGAGLALIEWYFRYEIDAFIFSEGYWILLIPVVIILLVRIHPEPADQCPCFDDGVAFVGVIMGVDVGQWHFAQSDYSLDLPVLGTVPFEFEHIGMVKTILRIALGIFVIFTWRAVMKPLLHFFLPPIYRFVEEVGFSLPRRHFINASEYKKVPAHLPDETLFPITQLPNLIRNVRRARSDSVGPQSAADVYESMACRERSNGGGQGADGNPEAGHQPASFNSKAVLNRDTTSDDKKNNYGATSQVYDASRADALAREQEIFDIIEKPRVRYDVEVVTKLLVYAGIAWWTVEGTPLLYELFGLGVIRASDV